MRNEKTRGKCSTKSNMTRKQFIESQGATCQNWTWSWSFINKSEGVIMFGAWDRNTNGKTARILSEDWATQRGHKQAGYDQSREHMGLIEENVRQFIILYS